MNEQAPPLATLVEATLSEVEVEQLFADLAAYANVESVLVKMGPRDHTGTGSITLDEAKRRLLTGEVRAVQVRYRYDEVEWSDTLLRVPVGVRLVRCKHDSEAEHRAHNC